MRNPDRLPGDPVRAIPDIGRMRVIWLIPLLLIFLHDSHAGSNKEIDALIDWAIPRGIYLHQHLQFEELQAYGRAVVAGGDIEVRNVSSFPNFERWERNFLKFQSRK
jgi:hypothetical protein